jgi:hypothetical protein
MHGIRGTALSSRYVSGCAALSRYSSALGRAAGASSSWASGHTLLLSCDASKTEKVRCVQAHTSAPSLSAARTVTYRYAFVGVCGCVSVTLWCADTYIQCTYSGHETSVNTPCLSAVSPAQAYRAGVYDGHTHAVYIYSAETGLRSCRPRRPRAGGRKAGARGTRSR